MLSQLLNHDGALMSAIQCLKSNQIKVNGPTFTCHYSCNLVGLSGISLWDFTQRKVAMQHCKLGYLVYKATRVFRTPCCGLFYGKP